MASFYELREVYLATEVHFLNAAGQLCRTAPYDASFGPNQNTLVSTVDPSFVDAWVITASNPKSEELDDAANNAYNLALGYDLLRAGFPVESVVCSSPDGRWSESSFLVFGKTFEQSNQLAILIRDLAVKYGQNAVFRFIADEQQVVPVLDLTTLGSRKYTVAKDFQ